MIGLYPQVPGSVHMYFRIIDIECFPGIKPAVSKDMLENFMIRFPHIQVMRIINLLKNVRQVRYAMLHVKEIVVIYFMNGIGIAQQKHPVFFPELGQQFDGIRLETKDHGIPGLKDLFPRGMIAQLCGQSI